MKKKVINVLRYLLFLFLVLVVVFPILFIFMSSFKTTEEIYGNPWAFPQRVRMDSYIAVFTEYGILRNLINSVIYSSIKYSLQGTTQGNGLAGGETPVRFSM